MNESASHLQVKNLNLWYGKHQALKDITVDIPGKKITAIIGPSGCGKTTLLKSFNRLIELQDKIKMSGQILVDGENILDPKVEVTDLRKKMGLLLQKPQALPMSIYDNVAYGLRVHEIKGKKLIDRISKLEEKWAFLDVHLEKTRIRKGDGINVLVETYLRIGGLWDEVKDRLHTSASGLSIGQQQRLCLARALAVEPEVILADEPTSALDPISSQKIDQLLTELKKNYTIIMVTHILRQARRLADYAVFLYLGKLIEHGPAEQIFEHPREELTKEYMKGIIS